MLDKEQGQRRAVFAPGHEVPCDGRRTYGRVLCCNLSQDVDKFIVWGLAQVTQLWENRKNILHEISDCSLSFRLAAGKPDVVKTYPIA